MRGKTREFEAAQLCPGVAAPLHGLTAIVTHSQATGGTQAHRQHRLRVAWGTVERAGKTEVAGGDLIGFNISYNI